MGKARTRRPRRKWQVQRFEQRPAINTGPTKESVAAASRPKTRLIEEVVNRFPMDTTVSRHLNMCEYRTRGSSVADPYLETLFPGIKMLPAELMLRGIGSDPIPLGVVQHKLKELRMKAEPKCFVKLTQSKNSSITLFWITGQPKFWFVEENSRLLVLRRSGDFGSKERAMNAFSRETIRWVETTTLAQLLDVYDSV